ncbi:MAG: hypothetical protein ACK4SR_13720 [Thiobacillus sp.]
MGKRDSQETVEKLSITGATLGWTGYEALLGCFDDPQDGRLRITITITVR